MGLALLVLLALLGAGLGGLALRRRLVGADLAGFDLPRPQPMRAAPSAERVAVEARVRKLALADAGADGSAAGRLARLRAAMDSLGAEADLAGVALHRAAAGGPRAEWVIPTGADPARRLLYLHGGGFESGSPESHRPLTTELARRSGCVVLVPDYRLKPEHPRRAGIDDCRSAWRWLLDNGPAGPGPARALFLAGDSAGGNLALGLAAWLRDTGLRQAHAVVALSPGTDATLSSPSARSNVAHDVLLGPAFRGMARIPRPLLLGVAWARDRIAPTHPDVSPLRGALHDLPPTLVQASLGEVLLDDSVRYVNKARAAGSPAELQTWPGMLHVWPLFGRELPEANEALDEIARFLARHEPAAR